ncbi:MAG: TSUP family transporter [Oscillospiraceae bacterium]
MMNAIVGVITGIIASMGLGGGFVLLIWLSLFTDISQKAAQGINLLFFLPISLVSLIIHMKGGLINKSIIKKYLLGGIAGVVLGTFAMQIIPAELLRKLYALFLISFGIKELIRSGKDDKSKAPDATD